MSRGITQEFNLERGSRQRGQLIDNLDDDEDARKAFMDEIRLEATYVRRERREKELAIEKQRQRLAQRTAALKLVQQQSTDLKQHQSKMLSSRSSSSSSSSRNSGETVAAKRTTTGYIGADYSAAIEAAKMELADAARSTSETTLEAGDVLGEESQRAGRGRDQRSSTGRRRKPPPSRTRGIDEPSVTLDSFLNTDNDVVGDSLPGSTGRISGLNYDEDDDDDVLDPKLVGLEDLEALAENDPDLMQLLQELKSSDASGSDSGFGRLIHSVEDALQRANDDDDNDDDEDTAKGPVPRGFNGRKNGEMKQFLDLDANTGKLFNGGHSQQQMGNSKGASRYLPTEGDEDPLDADLQRMSESYGQRGRIVEARPKRVKATGGPSRKERGGGDKRKVEGNETADPLAFGGVNSAPKAAKAKLTMKMAVSCPSNSDVTSRDAVDEDEDYTGIGLEPTSKFLELQLKFPYVDFSEYKSPFSETRLRSQGETQESQEELVRNAGYAEGSLGADTDQYPKTIESDRQLERSVRQRHRRIDESVPIGILDSTITPEQYEASSLFSADSTDSTDLRNSDDFESELEKQWDLVLFGRPPDPDYSRYSKYIEMK